MDYVNKYRWLIVLVAAVALVYSLSNMVVTYISYSHPRVIIKEVTRVVTKVNRVTVTKEVKRPDGTDEIDTTVTDKTKTEDGKTLNSDSTPVLAPEKKWNLVVAYNPLSQGLQVGGGFNFIGLSLGVINPVMPLALDPHIYCMVRF